VPPIQVTLESAIEFIADDELVGIPHRVVIGDKGLERGMLEYKPRAGDGACDVPLETIVEFLQERTRRRH